MELKKSPKADLQGMKGLFTLIGLALSLSIAIGLFSWSQKEVEFTSMADDSKIEEIEVVISTQVEPPKQAPPKAVVAVSDFITVIDNSMKPEGNTSMFDQTYDESDVIVIKPVAKKIEEVVEEETPIIKAEVMPKFQGGDYNSTFRKWLGTEIKYPTVASENNITGRVIIQGVVEKDGRLTNLKVLANPDQSLTDEALRAIGQSPKWEPGLQRGKPVRVVVIIPVVFNL